MIETLLKLRFPQLERRYAVNRSSAKKIREDLIALNGGVDPGMDEFDPDAPSPRFKLEPAKKAVKKRGRKPKAVSEPDINLTEKPEAPSEVA